MTTADRMAVLDQGVVQQVGSPATLYDYPVNAFVANFVGTMNTLKGTIRSRQGDSWVFDVPGVGDLQVPVKSEQIKGQGQDAQLQLSFRPHTLKVDVADATQDARYIWMPGTVEASEFLGEFTRYRVRVGDQALSVDQPHFAGLSKFPVGGTVSLGLEPCQVRLFAG